MNIFYHLKYPIGINTFPMGYSLFLIDYSLFPTPSFFPMQNWHDLNVWCANLVNHLSRKMLRLHW